MPQTKQQLLDEAKKLGLHVEPSAKMADIRVLIKEATTKKPETKAESKSEEAKTVTAKAGKRSAKAVREAEEETDKKAMASTSDLEPVKAKTAVKPPRTKLERRSKGYRKVAEKVEADKTYSLTEAIGLAKNTSSVKFDASVELHLNLSVDPKQADQNVRDNVSLPAGSGKDIKIAALTDDPKEALSAGATIAGGDDLIEKIGKGELNFDLLISTPSYMPKLGKFARTLGPKGLMPNPKRGTVTTDIKTAVTEAKAGKVEYRVDSNGIVHLSVGKVSFSTSALKDNITAIMTSIRSNKPSSVKSNYLKSSYLTTTMGPSIKVDLNNLEA